METTFILGAAFFLNGQMVGVKNSSVLYVLPQSWTLPYARFPQSIAQRQEEKQEDVTGVWVIRRKLAEKMNYVS